MSNDTEHIAMQGSTVDYCDRWPEEGHNWSTTVHAVQHGQRIETRQCGSCGYLDVSEVAKALASSRSEGVAEGWRQAEAALRDVSAVADVLVQHTRTSIERCNCGWNDLGKRWSRHVVLYLADALASLAPTTEEPR